MRCIILSFILCTGIFQFNIAQTSDFGLLKNINNASARGDDTWEVITQTVTPVMIAAPVSMIVAGGVRKDEKLKWKGYRSAAALIVSMGVNTGLKHVLKRDRPYEKYPGEIFPKVKETGYSFPSGHTAAAFSTATSLSIAFPEWYVIIPSYLYAGAVGYSRMHLGVHYPTDVVGGMLTGTVCTWASWKLSALINRKKERIPVP